jgi:hypothetical protein
MGLDGACRDVEGGGYLGVGLAVGEEPDDLAFAFGQSRAGLGSGFGRGESGQEADGERGADEGVSV